MSAEPHVVSLSPSPMRAVPRAVWIGGGLLGMVTAALAGALVMRSVEPAPNGPPTATPASAAATAQTAPAIASAPTAQVATLPPTKPAHRSPPATTRGTAVQSQPNALDGTTHAAATVCANCGIVESVDAVRQKGDGTGLGVVAGGVLGGVVGHQVGGGKGKTAMTVLGAIGGGLAGNEVEKRARGETVFNVQVRMEDGGTRTFQRTESMAVGAHVVAEGGTLRLARGAGYGDAPRTLRTSTTAGGNT
jgi:outer membrane lipoprotein SlyB